MTDGTCVSSNVSECTRAVLRADDVLIVWVVANLRMVDFTNADLSGAYISSTTKFNGVKIDGSDWSDTLLRKDQQNFLCDMANGRNPVTGVDTKESLICLD